MIEEIHSLLDEYIAWLKDKTDLKAINDQWVEITTPYLDRHNDSLVIYARRDNGGYLLTDDGEIVQDLKMSGCNLDTPKRRDLLKLTLNGFGIQIGERDSLLVHASRENFPSRKHNLVQAMISVNDMFYLAEPNVAGLFYEDVVAWLDSKKIRKTARLKFTGKSGLDYFVDFVIPSSPGHPERILQLINQPNPERAKLLAFGWIETKETRPADSKAYALLNDIDQKVSQPVFNILRSYDIKPVTWSERESIAEELAA
jgi:hypothetical protein